MVALDGLALVGQLAQVKTVVEDYLDIAGAPGLSAPGGDALAIEELGNLIQALALLALGKHHLDGGGLGGVNLNVFAIRAVLVAKRGHAGGLVALARLGGAPAEKKDDSAKQNDPKFAHLYLRRNFPAV